MRPHRSSGVADVEFDYPDYREYGNDDEGMANFEVDEVVGDGSSRPRRHAPSHDDDDDDDDDVDDDDLTWMLTELALGCPTVIDLIPSFKTHVAYDI